MPKLVAFHLKDLTGFRGHASLYQLVPPYVIGDTLDVDVVEVHEYVVVSSVDLNLASFGCSIEQVEQFGSLFDDSETLIFPANEEGQITDYSELHGIKNIKDHEKALNELGYVIRKGIGKNDTLKIGQ